MERPCAAFRELQVVNASGIYCWSIWCVRGQVGAEGLGDVPREVGGGHSLTSSRSEPFQTQACGGLVELSALTREKSPAPGPQRAGLAWKQKQEKHKKSTKPHCAASREGVNREELGLGY